MGADNIRHDFTDSSENVHYDFQDAEAFRNAYRKHFSNSFHKIFSEVRILFLNLLYYRVLCAILL